MLFFLRALLSLRHLCRRRRARLRHRDCIRRGVVSFRNSWSPPSLCSCAPCRWQLKGRQLWLPSSAAPHSMLGFSCHRGHLVLHLEHLALERRDCSAASLAVPQSHRSLITPSSLCPSSGGFLERALPSFRIVVDWPPFGSSKNSSPGRLGLLPCDGRVCRSAPRRGCAGSSARSRHPRTVTEQALACVLAPTQYSSLPPTHLVRKADLRHCMGLLAPVRCSCSAQSPRYRSSHCRQSFSAGAGRHCAQTADPALKCRHRAELRVVVGPLLVAGITIARLEVEGCVSAAAGTWNSRRASGWPFSGQKHVCPCLGLSVRQVALEAVRGPRSSWCSAQRRAHGIYCTCLGGGGHLESLWWVPPFPSVSELKKY